MINQTQVIELEEKFWKAIQEGDIESAVSLTRFPCLISSPKGGQLVLEEDFRKMMAAYSGKSYLGMEMKNNLVQILNDDTAIISYEALLNGKTSIDTSTWVNENGNWQCAFHSEIDKIH